LSAQRGSHQACRPSSFITAGPRVIRTTKASSATPIARPNAIGLMLPSPAGTKNANTENMISAAAMTTLAEWTKPSSIARSTLPWMYSSRIRLTRNTS